MELHTANKSSIAGAALQLIGELYQVERDIDGLTDPGERLAQRRSRSAPVAGALHDWLTAHRAKVPGGTATAKAIDFYEAGFVKPLAMRALSKS